MFTKKNLQKSKNKFLFFGASLLFLSATLGIFNPLIDTVSAQSADRLEVLCENNPTSVQCGGSLYESKDLDWQIRSLLYYNAIGYCINSSGASSGSIWGVADLIKRSDAQSGNWFMADSIQLDKGIGPNTDLAPLGPYIRGDGLDDADIDVRVNCGNLDPIITKALQMWGWSPDEALCAFGYYRYGVAESERTSLCTNSQRGGDDKDWDARDSERSEVFSKYKTAVQKKVYGNKDPNTLYPSLTYIKSLEYKFYSKVFMQACAKNKSPSIQYKTQYNPSDPNSSVFKIIVVNDDGTSTEPEGSYYIGTQKRNQIIHTKQTSAKDASTENLTCAQIETLINDRATIYSAYAKDNPSQTQDSDFATSNNNSTAKPDSSCRVDGIGWIICPVINFLAGIADGAFVVLSDSFLRTDPEVVNTSSTTYTAWSIMRNFANVAFVIVFLIIIFSQLSSIGVSNYGVKKMLPRLIIGAILVNISFFISQLAVDLSNILGYSLRDVFNSITNSVSNATAQDAIENISPFSDGKGFAGIAGSILAGSLIGVALYATLSTLIPVVLAAVVALVMIMFILVARQAIIILLVVISPLAFVAYLLPNTESLFKKWRQLLTSMLLLFPIIAIVFGASTLASEILSDTFNGGIAGDTENWFGQIIAAAVLVLPLFAVPILLKKSLDGISGLGSTISNLRNKASGAASKAGGKAYENSRIGQFKKYRESERNNRRALTQSGQYSGRNVFRRGLSKVNSGINNQSGQFGTRLAASGVSLAAESNKKDVAAAELLLGAEGLSRPKLRERALQSGGDPAMKQAAINKIIESNDIHGINQMLEAANDWSQDDRSHLADKLNSSSKRPAYIGQGTLAKLRMKEKQSSAYSVKQLVSEGVLANAYSPAKLATGDADELAFVAEQAAQLGGAVSDKLSLNATEALSDENLAPTISKNLSQVKNLAAKQPPNPGDISKLQS